MLERPSLVFISITYEIGKIVFSIQKREIGTEKLERAKEMCREKFSR